MAGIGDGIILGSGGPVVFRPFPLEEISAPPAGQSALIFPALSKAPQVSTVLKYDEAGTIADPMEAGYVSTRPRFTRTRRTWSVSYRGLSQIDMAVVDFFIRQQSVAGAGSFWFPNQLYNGGMEIPDDLASLSGAGDVVAGWDVEQQAANLNWTNKQELNPANVLDGGRAMLLSFNANQTVPNGTSVENVVGHRSDKLPYSIVPGESYLAVARFLISASLVFPANVTGTLTLILTINYDDQSQDVFASAPLTSQGLAGVWQEIAVQGNVAGVFGSGKQPVSIDVTIQHGIINSTGSNWVMGASGTPWDVRVDACGLALSSSPYPYGAVAGACAIPCLVRFTKVPQAAQISAGLYSLSFEVTEV